MKPGNSRAAAPVTTPKKRMDWPDVARGLSILGVVLLHVSMSIPGGKETFLAELNHFLDPIRMPLFFLVSGFFSAKVLDLSFEQLFKRRLWFFLVPYLCWGPVELYTQRIEARVYNGFEMPDFSYYTDKIFNGTNMYWFLYFLVWFNLLLWVSRKFPAWVIVILVAVGPWLLMPMFGENEVLRKTLIYLPVFFIGAYFRPLIMRFAEAASRPKALLVALAFYLVGMGINALDDFLQSRTPGTYQLWLISLKNDIAILLGGELTAFSMGHLSGVLVRIFSLPAGIVLAVWLAKVKPVARVLRFAGAHTLVIYLGHALGLTILFGYTLKWDHMVIDNESTNPLNWTGTWMLIAFVLAIAGAYLLHLISKVPVLAWTLFPPKLPEAGMKERPVNSPNPAAQISAHDAIIRN